MVGNLKRLFFGLTMAIVFSGIIAFIIALLLNIDGYKIIFNDEQRNNAALVYVIYGLTALILVSTLFFMLTKKQSGLFWTFFSVIIVVFFIAWFPVYREASDVYIVWLAPGVIAIVFSLIALWGMTLNIRIRKSEKKVEREILNMLSIFETYHRLQDAKDDDKSCINTAKGMSWKDDCKFYRIDYAIKEHDK